MYMTQFPNDYPPMPAEFMDAVAADPGAFADAMGGGMEAMQTHMEANPGDMEGGMEAMGAAMEGPMGDMGISPEAFEAAGDTFGAVAGPAMMGMPADAGPADMGAMMNDAMEHAMPEGMDMPPEMGPMFDNMAQTFDAADMGPHDMGAEFGPADMDPPTGDMGGCSGDMTGITGGMGPMTGDMTDMSGPVVDMDVAVIPPLVPPLPMPEMPDAFDTASPDFASPEMTEARAEVNDAAAMNDQGQIEVAPDMANPAHDMAPVAPNMAGGGEAAGMGAMDSAMDQGGAPGSAAEAHAAGFEDAESFAAAQEDEQDQDDSGSDIA
jgi:hypothetical protein